jgi:dihydrofolate reductase
LPTELPAKAEIVNGGIKSIIAALNNRRINNLYIDGGLTIQSFLKEDLIDEMTITRVPILLGSGIPLFDLISSELMFDHIETEVLNNMLVRSKYNRVREL